jgi:L-aminopeptidase/D-esterase-like protein
VNAITDVFGVEVGSSTLIEGTSIRTGVTAVRDAYIRWPETGRKLGTG